jgi:hypothetical protein
VDSRRRDGANGLEEVPEMETYRDRIPVTMPSGHTGPGSAVSPGVLPVHEGTGLPCAGGLAGRRAVRGSAPQMRITVPGSDLHIIDAVTTDFTNDVPGPRTWSPTV